MSNSHGSRGNRREQRRRRRNNNHDVPIQYDDYRLIDGNYSNRPYKYCCHYRAFLTRNQVVRHSCERKSCTQLKSLEWFVEHRQSYNPNGRENPRL